ncbi:putative anion transporter 6, chloroplastic [Vitis vinifera]|nr:putative anion transporter 6, chloroplastic [Vitis vinifera]
MAKFAFTTENICCFPRHTNSLFNNTSLKHRQLLIFSSKQRSQLRVFSAIRGKESVTETESVITGLRVDELDNSASASDAEGQEEGGEVGFDWNWPPWKNLPQRYKLIGTTSLAFVVCNMDKVVFFFLGISWYTLSSSEMIFLLIELPWVMWLQGNRKVKEC